MNANEIQLKNGKWKSPFFAIWTGQAFSLLGSQLVQFALIWWLTKTTGSATVLATASLVGLLPQVIVGPLAGAFVDRWNRRITMIVADALVALATLVLIILFYTGLVQVWHIYLIMLLRATAGGFQWPAMQASISLMVPKEHLSRIQGLNQMLNGAMNIGAAPMGAVLMSLLPMHSILSVDIATAFLAVLPLFFIPIPQPEHQVAKDPTGGKASVWQDLIAGFRYVWAWPGLVMILVMATLINLLLNPASALQPILVSKHFGGGAMQLAWMELAWGIGVVAGGLTLSAWGGFRRRVLTSLAGLVALGIGMFVVGVLPSSALLMAVGMMFFVGFTNPIVNGPLFAVLQSVVAPEMQGRVFNLVLSVASLMTPVGLILAGPVADTFGVQSWFVVGGILTALLGFGAFFVPAIVGVEDSRGEAAESASTETGPSPRPVKASAD